MQRRLIRMLAISGFGLVLAGCASGRARYVYQDHESGVIALPKNTPRYMTEAKKMMESHFPGENYEVVRAVEVDTGGTLATYAADSGKADLGMGAWALRKNLAGLGLKGESERKQAESRKVSECRVVYHKKSPNGKTTLAFADAPDFTPQAYSDEVSLAVLGIGPRAAAAASASVAGASASPKDSGVRLSAGEIIPPPLPQFGKPAPSLLTKGAH